MLGGMSAVLTCSLDSPTVEAMVWPFLRREILVMGGYPPVAEQTRVVFWFCPFCCSVNNGRSAIEKKTCPSIDVLLYLIPDTANV